MNILTALKQYGNDVVHLFYPHHCIGCGTDVIDLHQTLCLQCFSQLPVTDYFFYANNPIEVLFAGRILIQQAGSAFYFTKQSLLQHVMHEIKYKGNTEAAHFMGKQTGLFIQQSGRFQNVDALVALPLSHRRFQQRGYNQAALLAQGMAEVLQKPVLNNVIERKKNTATQTSKGRSARWQAMQEVFALTNAASIAGKHILLVDDIITTGATLEACGEVLLSVPGTMLSIATAAYTI